MVQTTSRPNRAPLNTSASPLQVERNLYRASNEWRRRPDDQRYLTLESLYEATHRRHQLAVEAVSPLDQLYPYYDDQDRIFLTDKPLQAGPPDPAAPKVGFTHHAFGQACTTVGAPARFLRDLPVVLTTPVLSYMMAASDKTSKLLVVPGSNDQDEDAEFSWGELRSFTSESYGRIWDDEVAQSLLDLNAVDGRWVVPAASYQGADPKRATTLYASDHDLFAFLVDPSRPIEVAGETLFRGFMVWNSEVGSRTFGLMTFLYRFCCDNRIIWGASEVSKVIIRHTMNGPSRFAEQAMPALRAYSEGSTTKLEGQIREAKARKVGKDTESVLAFLKERGFGQEQAKVSVELAEREEGDPTTVWNVVQGLTAYARGLAHTDTRVNFEQKASDLMSMVTA